MKKTTRINLILISAALASCNNSKKISKTTHSALMNNESNSISIWQDAFMVRRVRAYPNADPLYKDRTIVSYSLRAVADTQANHNPKRGGFGLTYFYAAS